MAISVNIKVVLIALCQKLGKPQLLESNGDSITSH